MTISYAVCDGFVGNSPPLRGYKNSGQPFWGHPPRGAKPNHVIDHLDESEKAP